MTNGYNRLRFTTTSIFDFCLICYLNVIGIRVLKSHMCERWFHWYKWTLKPLWPWVHSLCYTTNQIQNRFVISDMKMWFPVFFEFFEKLNLKSLLCICFQLYNRKKLLDNFPNKQLLCVLRDKWPHKLIIISKQNINKISCLLKIIEKNLLCFVNFITLNLHKDANSFWFQNTEHKSTDRDWHWHKLD
jgi:hypothetical protein